MSKRFLPRTERKQLVHFQRFVELGLVCVVQVTTRQEGFPDEILQISLTHAQCLEIAENLFVAAQVIERERPTSAQ